MTASVRIATPARISISARHRVCCWVSMPCVSSNRVWARIAQQLVQVRHAERLPGPAGRRRRRQPSVGQLGQQASDRPFARRIGLKRPGHQRPTLGIYIDRPIFPPALKTADVQVAHGGSARGAAVLGLLCVCRQRSWPARCDAPTCN